MARWAIGDLQGCCREFRALLASIGYRADRDQLWLTGDLVNRGPESLEVLRLVHAMRDNLVCVLGNHDLHLLARASDPALRPRKSDTLDEVLAATDREQLLDWLQGLPLAHCSATGGDLLVHAGLVPQWQAADAMRLAAEVEQALRQRPAALFASMYGDQPDRWSESLSGGARLRFIVNCLTRLRYCTREGQVNLQLKDAPDETPAPWLPWFRVPDRASRGGRIIFGHWSALGFLSEPGLLALDTGCVWGDRLTAVDLDDPAQPPVTMPSQQPRWREQ